MKWRSVPLCGPYGSGRTLRLHIFVNGHEINDDGNSIKFAVIHLHGHVCMQFHSWPAENGIRFAYISIHADG